MCLTSWSLVSRWSLFSGGVEMFVFNSSPRWWFYKGWTLHFPIRVEVIQFSSNKEKTDFGTELLDIQHMNLMVSHGCSIIHRLKCQLKEIKVVLRLSWHALIVRSCCLFSITHNHKTNHQVGSVIFRTPLPRHKVHMSILLCWLTELRFRTGVFARVWRPSTWERKETNLNQLG